VVSRLTVASTARPCERSFAIKSCETAPVRRLALTALVRDDDGPHSVAFTTT